MAGPWEQFQTQPQAPAAPAGPWTRFQTAPAAAPPVDLRRSSQQPIDNLAWYRARYGEPEAGVDFGTIRRQEDPEGARAWDDYAAGVLPDYGTTDGWDDQSNLIPISGPGQFLRRAVNSATLGWSDEIAGLLGGDTERERQLLEGYAVASPMGARAADLVGGAATAVVPGGAIARGATTGSRILRGATAGAGVGAVAGAGLSDADTWQGRLEGARNAAIPAGVIGGAIPVVAPAVARSLRGIIPDRATLPNGLPTSDDLRAAANSRFDRADNAGLIVPQGELSNFYINARRTALDMGADLDPGPGVQSNTPLSAGLLRRIDAATSSAGLPPGLQRSYDLRELSRIREAAGGAARNFSNPHDQSVAMAIRDQFDDWLDGLDASSVVAGNPQEALAALTEARDLWRRMRRTEVLEQLENTAELRSASSPRSQEMIFRDLVRRMAENPRQMRGFTEQEQALIRNVATGGPVRQVLEMFARFAPSGFFPQLLAGVGVGTGNVPLVALSAGGLLARGGVNRSISNSIDALNRELRLGPQSGQPAGTDALIRALTSANISQTPQETQALVPSMIQLLRGQPLPVR